MTTDEGQAQGRPGQEGQAQGPQEEVEAPCVVCNRQPGAHEGMRHLYTPVGQPVDTSQFARKRVNRAAEGATTPPDASAPQGAAQTPFRPAPDMVLRQALLNAGVITFADIDNAQQTIEALTGAILREADRGE